MKICLTGGIACGKSLFSSYLNELGIETLDADDIVHELIPADERRRLAAVVFKDDQARKDLEAKIHPLVKARIEEFLSISGSSIRVAIIPLLFEVHWEQNFDIICCVASSKESQISRMMATRGMSRAEAESRLRAQLPMAVKVEKSHYIVNNNGSNEELRDAAAGFVRWLKTRKEKQNGR